MARPLDALRDTQREWMINRSRLIAALVGIFTLLLILVYRYYSNGVPFEWRCGVEQVDAVVRWYRGRFCSACHSMTN